MTRAYNVNCWDYPKPTKQHNDSMIKSAEKYARAMRKKPSWLERQMMEFLNNHNIKYETQKIFYIKDNNGLIYQYFIADFYIPKKKVIIEVDGKFHRKQREYDEYRTKMIKKHYPKVKVVRYELKNLQSYCVLKELLMVIQG